MYYGGDGTGLWWAVAGAALCCPVAEETWTGRSRLRFIAFRCPDLHNAVWVYRSTPQRRSLWLNSNNNNNDNNNNYSQLFHQKEFNSINSR